MQIHNNPTSPLKPQIAVRPPTAPFEDQRPSHQKETKPVTGPIDNADGPNELPDWMKKLAEAEDVVIPKRPTFGLPRRGTPNPPKILPPRSIGGSPPIEKPTPPTDRARPTPIGNPGTKPPIQRPLPIAPTPPTPEKQPPGQKVGAPPSLPAKAPINASMRGSGLNTGVLPSQSNSPSESAVPPSVETPPAPAPEAPPIPTVVDTQGPGAMDSLGGNEMESVTHLSDPRYNGTSKGPDMDSLTYQSDPNYNGTSKGPDMDPLTYQSDPNYNGTSKGPDMDSLTYQSDPNYNGARKGPDMDSLTYQSDPNYNGTNKGPEMNTISYQPDPNYNGASKGTEMNTINYQSDPRYNGTYKGTEMNTISYQSDPRYNGGISNNTGSQSVSVPPSVYSVTDMDNPTPVDGETFKISNGVQTTGDGLTITNNKPGIYINLHSKIGDFSLQTRESKINNSPNTFTISCGLRLGPDIVNFNASNGLILNGKLIEVKDGQTLELPGGGKIRRLDDKTVEFISNQKDKVLVSRKGDKNAPYLEIEGELAPGRRSEEIRGSLGMFDSGTKTNNDLVGRTGKIYSAQEISAFFEEWRARDDEMIFY